MSAIYSSDIGFELQVADFKKRVATQFYLSIGIMLAVAATMCYSMLTKSGDQLDVKLILVMLTFFALTTQFLYVGTELKSGKINKTVIEISFGEETVTVKTAPLYFSFGFKKPQQILTFSNATIKMRRVAFPIKEIFDIEGQTIKLTDKEKEVWLILDYFDPQVLVELRRLQG